MPPRQCGRVQDYRGSCPAEIAEMANNHSEAKIRFPLTEIVRGIFLVPKALIQMNFFVFMF